MKVKRVLILGGIIIVLLVLLSIPVVLFGGYYIYNKYVAASTSTVLATTTTVITSTSSVFSTTSTIHSTTTIKPTLTTSTSTILPMPEGSKCNEQCWQKSDNSYCEIQTKVLQFTDSGGYSTHSVTYQGYCKKCMCYSLEFKK